RDVPGKSGHVRPVGTERRDGSDSDHSAAIFCARGAYRSSLCAGSKSSGCGSGYESVEQSINVTGDRINELPLNFGGGGGAIGSIRAPLTFMILSPGVSGTGTTGRVNGQTGSTYRVFVDGQDTTNNNDT